MKQILNTMKPAFLVIGFIIFGLSITSVHAAIYLVDSAKTTNTTAIGLTTVGVGDWANATSNLQNAINTAASGDVVWVKGGTYQPASGQGFIMNEGVKIYGNFAGTETTFAMRDTTIVANTSTLLGNGTSVVLNNNNNLSRAAVLDGFTITGGAGVYTTYQGTTSFYGGGMFNAYASPTISHCVFSNNILYNATSATTLSGGGGMCLDHSSPVISNSIFINNTAGYGGGIFQEAYCGPTITGCSFIQNHGQIAGGGIFTFYDDQTNDTTVVTNSFFSGNYGGRYGGGINFATSLVLTNCIFTLNTCLTNGAAIYLDEINPVITNCLFVANRLTQNPTNNGGVLGEFMNGPTPLMHVNNCSFFGNYCGTPVYLGNHDQSVMLTNCILWNNYTLYGNIPLNPMVGGNTTVNYCTIQGGFAGTNNLSAPPLFVDSTKPAGADGIYGTADDGLRLQSCSPAINAGSNSGTTAGINTDLIGNARIYNSGTVDMGAYEYQGDKFSIPTITAGGPTTFCAGGGVTLSAPAGYSYLWGSGGATTQAIAATASGSYTVTISNGNSCSATSAATVVTAITVPATTITASGSTTFCAGSSVTLSASAGNAYLWSPSGATTQAITVNQAGSYTVATTYASGCTSVSAALQVNVIFPGSILYVDGSITTSGSGNSWATAYKELRDALALARQQVCVSEIRVAGGTYYSKNDSNRDSSFTITRGGLKIYGGYPAGGGVNRDWVANPTTLDGTTTFPGAVGNSYHVVLVAALLPSQDSLVLDGLIITNGYAEDTTHISYGGQLLARNCGTGMALLSNSLGSRLAIRNCNFTNNASSITSGSDSLPKGTGVYNCSSASFTNCGFYGNSSLGGAGGGLYNNNAASLFTNCSFNQNNGNYGGAVYNSASTASYSGCTFSQNNAVVSSGAVYNHMGTDKFTQCIFSQNTVTTPSSYGIVYYNDAYSTASFSHCSFTGNKSTTNQTATGVILQLSNYSHLSVNASYFTANWGNIINTILDNTQNSNSSLLLSGSTFYHNFKLLSYNPVTSLSMGKYETDTLVNNLFVEPGTAFVLLGNSHAFITGNTFYNSSSFVGNAAITVNTTGAANLIANNIFYKYLFGDISPAAPSGFYTQANNNSSTTNPLFANEASFAGVDSIFGTADDGLRLQSCSPAINAGSNSYVPANITTDLAGNARIQGTAVDMGAYEFTGLNNGNPNGADLLAINGDAATINIVAAQGNMLMATNSVCRTVANILPDNTATQVSGSVNAQVWVDAALAHNPANGFPYVQRHYDISPVTNAANATAFVTLYFTQAEFNAFNTDPKTGTSTLPTNTSDAAGKARLRIFQYHGISSDGSGLPASYTGINVTIDPVDANINWNNTLQRWEVGFQVTGFSGFFAGVDALNVLPVTLVSFTANLTTTKAVALQWNVAEQSGIKSYIVERSVDGNNFSTIGSVVANGLLATNYNYTDALLPIASTLYYRLSIIGIDGTMTYSSIVSVKLSGNNPIIIYPNPAKDIVWLKGGATSLIGTDVFLTDMQGRTISKTHISVWPMQINTSTLADGVYLIKLEGNQTFKMVVEK